MTFDPLQQSGIPIYVLQPPQQIHDLPNRYVPSDFLKIYFPKFTVVLWFQQTLFTIA